jgi:hypothetical protein
MLTNPTTMKRHGTPLPRSWLTAVLLGALACTCQAGPENREKIKQDAKATWEKTRDLARGLGVETKEFVRLSTDKARVIGADLAKHARQAAKKTTVVVKDVAATTKEVLVETTDRVKDTIKEATD